MYYIQLDVFMKYYIQLEVFLMYYIQLDVSLMYYIQILVYETTVPEKYNVKPIYWLCSIIIFNNFT